MKAAHVVVFVLLLLFIQDATSFVVKKDEKPQKEKKGLLKRVTGAVSDVFHKDKQTPEQKKEAKDEKAHEKVVDELAVEDQTEDVAKIIDCGAALHTLSYPQMVRLMYRVLNEMIADTLTFGDIVAKGAKKIKDALVKGVKGLTERFKKWISNWRTSRAKAKTEVKEPAEITDEELDHVVETLDGHEMEEVAQSAGEKDGEHKEEEKKDEPQKDDKKGKDPKAQGKEKDKKEDPKKEEPKKEGEEKKEGEGEHHGDEIPILESYEEGGHHVPTREILLSKTMFRLLVFLTDMLFPHVERSSKPKVKEVKAKLESANNPAGEYNNMLHEVVELYSAIRDEMAKKPNSKAEKNAALAALEGRVETMLKADKHPTVLCPVVTMVIGTFQERFESHDKRDEMIVSAAEAGFKLLKFGLQLGAAAGSMAASGFGGPAAGRVAGQVAEKAIDATMEVAKMMFLSALKQTMAVRAFRRNIRMTLLTTFNDIVVGAAENVTGVNDEQKKTREDDPPEVDCYKGVLRVYRMILLMLNAEHDAEIIAARNKCVEDSRVKNFWKNPVTNFRTMKFVNFPERFLPILTFISNRAGFDHDIGSAMSFPQPFIDLGKIVGTKLKAEAEDIESKLLPTAGSFAEVQSLQSNGAPHEMKMIAQHAQRDHHDR